jgi:glycosyltransferase involved in cell wall biosynthesis
MSSSDYLVSVVIPCYNAEKYVAEAIESVLKQSYKNVETIVVDDGSTDHSIEVIRSFGDRVRLEQISHQGACAARNRGLQLSRGEFIQFLDADDRLVSNKFERQVPHLMTGEVDLVFCKGFIFGDDRPIRPKKSPIKSPVGIDPFVYCLDQGLSTEGPLHRKSKLVQVHGFTEGISRAQEYELHVRLGAAGIKILLLDELLYEHRNHSSDTRITKVKQPKDHLLKLYLRLEQTLRQQAIYTMTPARVEALAGKIFQHSIYAFRNGFESSAAEGFAVAQRLSKQPIYSERNWYKLLVKLTDPIAVERWLQQGRYCRSFLLNR